MIFTRVVLPPQRGSCCSSLRHRSNTILCSTSLLNGLSRASIFAAKREAEKGRENGREGKKEKERGESGREREKERKRGGEGEGGGEKKKREERERQRETETDRENQKDREIERDRERQRESLRWNSRKTKGMARQRFDCSAPEESQ